MNDARDVVRGDLWIDGNRIVSVGAAPPGARATETVDTIDAAGGIVLPGFIQTHIHLCQTLFRGTADDRPLLAWLRQRIWPLEAAHTPPTLAAAARLAAAELMLGGTTTVLTMETVHDTDAVFEALVPTGLRAVVGKCLMDVRCEAPARLHQTWRDGLDESEALARRCRRPSPSCARAAVCNLVFARAARGGSRDVGGRGLAGPHSCIRTTRGDRGRARIDGHGQHRVPRRGWTRLPTAVCRALRARN